MRKLTPAHREEVIHFRNLFREAREQAIKDAENFDAVIFALEKLGSYSLEGKGEGLGKCSKALLEIANHSPLANPKDENRDFHTPFAQLFDLVRNARNDAMHTGVYARHLTQHTIEIAIVIEDALNQIIAMKTEVRDVMVRDVSCAEMWHPLSFIRQAMLGNSFTCLPVFCKNEEKGKKWKLVCDLAIASYIQNNERTGLRKVKLAHTLEEAISTNSQTRTLELKGAIHIEPDTSIEDALNKMRQVGYPSVLLVVNPKVEDQLLGILMPFDLL